MTAAQKRLISKSPKFCITEKGKYLENKSDVYSLTRKLKIIDNFQDNQWSDDSLVKNPSTAEIRTNNPWMKNICRKIESLEPEKINTKDNVSELL